MNHAIYNNSGYGDKREPLDFIPYVARVCHIFHIANIGNVKYQLIHELFSKLWMINN